MIAGMFRSRPTRTLQPVHRHSRHAGDRELDLWRRYNTFSKSEHNARMRAVEQYDRETKKPGKRNGALGYIALEIMRFMLRLRGKRGGRLDPSLKWLADQLHRSRSAIAAALARLKQHGFLDWVRRTRLVDDPARPEQYVEQISNAYFFGLPKGAADLVRRMLRRPSEEQQRRSDEAARATRAATTSPTAIIAGVTDPALRATLAGLDHVLRSANPLNGLNRPCGDKE
ncbi:hypothetical protein EAH84_03270 [Sphingomonas oligophenolica]|uniref:Helix-turn-helix domain-containing protein n=1 Tax=Sphingomonas oligophenolica TaxID=301154 RepID=A0A502CND9_9SPHN|nr:hypothetical protein EAH84_03270 [Sphingomonas oligophenolica]